MLYRLLVLALLGLPSLLRAQTFTTLYDWQVSDHDWNPNGDLLVDGARIFGTIEFNASFFENPNDTGCGGYGCGSVFRLADGQQTTVHAFTGGDGGMLAAGVIQVGNTLYGTTTYGGGACTTIPEHCGTIFALDAQSGALTVLHAFSGGLDGGGSVAKLLLVNGLLFGTTSVGGLMDGCNGQGCGTIFRLDPTTGDFATVYRFSSADGTGIPDSGLTRVGPLLYGTTLGYADSGTVFRFDPGDGSLTILHRFGQGTDGQFPSSDLKASSNHLYGTTREGGSSDNGAIYDIDLPGGGEHVISSFNGGLDGYLPAGPIALSSGMLYGAVPYTYVNFFNIYPAGNIYALDLATGIRTILVALSFNGSDINAQTPIGVTFSRGLLYGVTEQGGNLYSLPGTNVFASLGVAFSQTP